MVRAGIVGLGRWGQNLVRSVQGRSDRIRFVRGVVRRPERVADFAAEHDLRTSADFGELLADPGIDAVVLATPNSLHVSQILAAAAVGKPVLSEKPLALTRADAERAVEACRRAGVTLGVCQDKRWWASMRELRRVVAEGVLGEILHVEGHFSNENARSTHAGWRESPVEAPGLSITATGIHVLDAFVSLLGPVRRVQVLAAPRRSVPAPLDSLAMTLAFASGATGVLCGVRPTPLYWRVHAFGAEASVEALGPRDLVLRLAGGEVRRDTFETVDALRYELEAFADAVAGKAPYPIPAAQMIDTAAALEAIVASLRSGGAAVEVPGST